MKAEKRSESLFHNLGESAIILFFGAIIALNGAIMENDGAITKSERAIIALNRANIHFMAFRLSPRT